MSIYAANPRLRTASIVGMIAAGLGMLFDIILVGTLGASQVQPLFLILALGLDVGIFIVSYRLRTVASLQEARTQLRTLCIMVGVIVLGGLLSGGTGISIPSVLVFLFAIRALQDLRDPANPYAG